MQTSLCPFCMNPADCEICPHCGKNINHPGKIGHLPVGFTLQWMDTYVLGAAIGQGGFGITYIAVNAVTMEKVAIKEYFPTHCCTRTEGVTVYPYSEQEETFAKGKAHFLEEARMLKSLADLDSVVKVRDFFEANNSAYLVMEYLDGLSLKDHVEKNGKLPAQQFLNQMKPLMADMEKMHRRGVVHRDIAPDNIILLPDGRLKLIDFGAARSYVGDKSMTVVVKKGFAPVEQYMRKGSNASTDVYALAATIYYCITGIVPPDSAERQYGDAQLQAPTSLGVELSREQERALEKALEIQPKERIQSVAALMQALAHIPKSMLQKQEEERRQQNTSTTNRSVPSKNSKSTLKWILPTAAVIVLAVCSIFPRSHPDSTPDAPESIVMPVAEDLPEVTVPEPKPQLPPAQTYVMSSTGYGDYYFWGQTEYRDSDVRSLHFLSSLESAPADAYDVSESQDRSILMWMNDGALTVAANGRISPGSDASRMFCSWDNLEYIDFGTVFDTSGVTNMAHMFQGCSKLSKLDLSSFDTTNVTHMGSMFMGCTSLESLDITGFDTSSVTDMSYMFHCCENLTELDVSGFDTSGVTSSSYMFGECKRLSVLDVSSFDTANITNMTGMFMNCHAVTHLDVRGFDTSCVEITYYMFYNCSALSNLDVSSFDTSHIKNMGYMFYGCKSLSDLDVSNFEIAEGTYTHDMFGNCSLPVPDWYDR